MRPSLLAEFSVVITADLAAVASGELLLSPERTLDLLDCLDAVDADLADHDRDDFADELRVA